MPTLSSFRLRVVACLATSVICFSICSLACRADEAEESAKTFVAGLRDACKTSPGLAGVHVTSAKADKGELQLQGYVARESQGSDLKKEADRLVGAKPEWKALFPKGVSTMAMKPITVLAVEVKKALDTHDDPKEIEVLRQTRLDSAAYDNAKNEITFEGKCSALGAPSAPELFSGAIAKALKKVLPAGDESPLVAINITSLDKETNPILALERKLVEQEKRDDVAVQEWWYDENGTLYLKGLVGMPERLSEIDRFFEARPANDPGLRPSDERTPRWSRSNFKVVPWPLSPKNMQAVLAADKSPIARQTRLDRAYFAHGDKAVLHLWFTGVCCHPDLDKAKLQELLSDAASRVWPTLKDSIGPERDVGGIVSMGQPLFTELQKEVSGRPDLDGTRIEKGAYFTKDGALVLTGLWAGPQQEKTLSDLVKKSLESKLGLLIERGLSLPEGAEGFRASGVEGELFRLRRWTADKQNLLEDTWLDRLYFDAQGHLVLSGTITPPAGDMDVKATMKKMLEEFAVNAKIEQAAPEAQLKENAKGFAGELRGMMASTDPRWDGVLIERGYYDPDGAYVLSGVLGSASQEAALKNLLEKMEREGKWHSLSGKGLSLAGFRVLEMKPMLQRLQKVMPAFVEFDGISLKRAYHDAKGRLVLACDVVGPRAPDAKAAEKMTVLLRTHPEWGLRAEGGVVFEVMNLEPEDRARAVRALADAQLALKMGDYAAALEQLATVKRHDPSDSTAWCLSAACHLARDEKSLAKLDLRRMMLVEKISRGRALPARLRKMESVQGGLRQRLAELEVEVDRNLDRELAEGKPAVSLLE